MSGKITIFWTKSQYSCQYFRPEWELFDRKYDPFELHNVAKKTKYQVTSWHSCKINLQAQIKSPPKGKTKFDMIASTNQICESAAWLYINYDYISNMKHKIHNISNVMWWCWSGGDLVASHSPLKMAERNFRPLALLPTRRSVRHHFDQPSSISRRRRSDQSWSVVTAIIVIK